MRSETNFDSMCRDRYAVQMPTGIDTAREITSDRMMSSSVTGRR